MASQKNQALQKFQIEFAVDGASYKALSLEKADVKGGRLASVPFVRRVLLENVLRTAPDGKEKDAVVEGLFAPSSGAGAPEEFYFYPSRILIHDFTITALVDLASMREAMTLVGGDPRTINPLIPVAVTIDHSMLVDHFGSPQSLESNSLLEYQRNGERLSLLKWAGKAMSNMTVVPPCKGICHQLHLEYFSPGYLHAREQSSLVYPDSMVGADSHTGTIGGIGVLAYGIGGIEIETIMLGEPSVLSMPDVVGVRLSGALRPGVTATDAALAITALLRKEGVVEKFVEYTGPGIDSLSIPARCTIANMAPEYGATVGFFPVDAQVIRYLKTTGREKEARLTEAAAKAGGLFRDGSEAPSFSRCIEFDLSGVEPGIAGPSRPQQHIPLKKSAAAVAALLEKEEPKKVVLDLPQAGENVTFTHGNVALAAITSCTNTINPELVIGAGLLAQKAVARGLKVPPYVKTVLAPGSTTVTRYLKEAGLLASLEALGFNAVGYSCLTCIGNSGPLIEPVAKAITENGLNAAAVLSANRNFEGRVHSLIKSNFLASPMLVVAFALAGTVRIDMENEPLGHDAEGKAVFLKDVLPAKEEIDAIVSRVITPELFTQEYSTLLDGGPRWEAVPTLEGPTFIWDADSTYIKKPPYFEGFTREPAPLEDIHKARVLVFAGDSVTTDHISPAGTIPAHYPAGRYLQERGVAIQDFNTYGTRRGNHEVMVRGTFGNTRFKNLLVAPEEGSYTQKFPQREKVFIFDAAEAYRKEGVPLVIIAGKEYGTGSSRDWAAKGVYFLGVRVIMAGSYERIHRDNLVGMGILPLQFLEGDSAESLGLRGDEEFTFTGLSGIGVGGTLEVQAAKADGKTQTFSMRVRLDTPSELACFRNGGILPYVLRKLISRE